MHTYTLTVEPGIENYLGVQVHKSADSKTYELKQPFLIERILKTIDMDSKHNERDTPAQKPLLHKDSDGALRKRDWHYRSVIGMLNYLQGSTCPDISMATHQCDRFLIDPKLSHERGIT